MTLAPPRRPGRAPGDPTNTHGRRRLRPLDLRTTNDLGPAMPYSVHRDTEQPSDDYEPHHGAVLHGTTGIQRAISRALDHAEARMRWAQCCPMLGPDDRDR